MSKEKSRFFTFLMYPDANGFPSDWRERLEKIGLPIAISPLHDQDKAKGGGFKKAHYHGIYIAKNPVTSESVRNKLKAILSSEREECKAIAMVQIIRESVDNVYLYLTHESKDAMAKAKHVYDKKDIVHINNFDIERYITLDVETKNDIFNIIVALIRNYHLQNLFDLYDFVDEQGDSYGLTINLVNDVIANKTGFIKLLFDGAYQRSKRLEEIEKLKATMPTLDE